MQREPATHLVRAKLEFGIISIPKTKISSGASLKVLVGILIVG